jgi:hypothetical protein
MTKRKLAAIVYLSPSLTNGRHLGGYTVRTGYFDGMCPFEVPSVLVGNAFVRALRDIAAKRPELFPPSRIEES